MQYRKLVIFVLFFTSWFCFAQKFKKILPTHLQKAYVIQKDAIVYSRPDFDALRITTIPAGSLVTISKKVYRPKTHFGTFYHIYIVKPKKLRAYISEIDVVPHYIRRGLKYQLNPEFKMVKKKLRKVRQFEANSAPDQEVDLSEKQIAQMRWIGMTLNHWWVHYDSHPSAVHSWIFNIKFTGLHFPIHGFLTDVNTGISFAPPVINGEQVKKGYILVGDFLLKMVLLEAPSFLLTIGGGPMFQVKSAMPPAVDTSFQFAAAVAANTQIMWRLRERIALSIEGKLYYNFHERRFSSGLGGGVLVAF